MTRTAPRRGRSPHIVRIKGSQDLVNNLFRQPYTRIEFVMNDLKVSRLTAMKYLNVLAEDGFLSKHKFGRSNYYVNLALARVLTRAEEEGDAK